MGRGDERAITPGAGEDDISRLVNFYVDAYNTEFKKRVRGVTPDAIEELQRYPWPGNVRELRAVMGRAALLHDDEVLRPEHLPPEIGAALLATPPLGVAASGASAATAIPTLEVVELAHIRRVLELCDGNRTLAAQYLDITRQTLARKLGGGAGGGGADPEG